MTITIVLADDNQVYRESLKIKLDQDPDTDMMVVEQAVDGQEAIEKVQKLAQQSQALDLVIMDVSMHPVNGVEATRQILSTHPSVKVLALSFYDNKQFVKAMFQAGASGYMLKEDTFADLTRAIRAVTAGQTYFSSGLNLPGNNEPGHGSSPP